VSRRSGSFPHSLLPSELTGASHRLTTIAYGRLPSVTKSVTIENFCRPREIVFALWSLTPSATTALLPRWGPPSIGCLLLWRNLYNKRSSIQGTALRARQEMHWHREAVRWGSP